MSEQFFNMRLPDGSKLVDFLYDTENKTFWHFLPEDTVRWSVEQFGYEPRIIVSADNQYLLRDQYHLRFRSERDAMLFKMFWC